MVNMRCGRLKSRKITPLAARLWHVVGFMGVKRGFDLPPFVDFFPMFRRFAVVVFTLRNGIFVPFPLGKLNNRQKDLKYKKRKRLLLGA
jgi:hypothetical protein